MATLGFIGMGNMGSAMLLGCQKEFPNSELLFTEINIEKMNSFSEKSGVGCVASGATLVESVKYIVLAVKPQFLQGVLDEIRPYVRAGQVVISIVPARTIEYYERNLPEGVKIVRAMPNTPALVGAGMTGVCYDDAEFSAEEKNVISKFFNSFGKMVKIDEKLMNALVCASGSSPAYVYMFIEAMADSVVKYGIPRDMAYELVAQTVLGSAKMVLETKEHPGKLKDNVCSPGGTTIAGVAALEEYGFRNSIIKATDACFDKCQNL